MQRSRNKASLVTGNNAHVCCFEIKVCYLCITVAFFVVFVLVSAGSQIKMANARLNCELLHSVHLNF